MFFMLASLFICTTKRLHHSSDFEMDVDKGIERHVSLVSKKLTDIQRADKQLYNQNVFAIVLALNDSKRLSLDRKFTFH